MIVPLLVFSAFCPACTQDCCQFGCHIDYVYNEADPPDRPFGSGYYRVSSCWGGMSVYSAKECKKIVEDECGKPASEKRWRELDNPFEDVDWDVYAPWDVTDGNCFCNTPKSEFCIEGM